MTKIEETARNGFKFKRTLFRSIGKKHLCEKVERCLSRKIQPVLCELFPMPISRFRPKLCSIEAFSGEQHKYETIRKRVNERARCTNERTAIPPHRSIARSFLPQGRRAPPAAAAAASKSRPRPAVKSLLALFAADSATFCSRTTTMTRRRRRRHPSSSPFSPALPFFPFRLRVAQFVVLHTCTLVYNFRPVFPRAAGSDLPS